MYQRSSGSVPVSDVGEVLVQRLELVLPAHAGLLGDQHAKLTYIGIQGGEGISGMASSMGLA